MTTIKSLHEKWMKDAEYRKEYEALEEEFALAQAAAEVRRRTEVSLEPVTQIKPDSR
jgi:CO/xanthine dehydrogenase Mo-binding subunit